MLFVQHQVDSLSKPNLVACYHWHRWRRESTNFSLFKSRRAFAQIVSQHQSGTHWLKTMLANALSYQYDLPAPQYNHANDYIGGPKDAIVYPQIPRLISSHSIPPLVTPMLVTMRVLNLPKYIVLVRDIRASLVSNYRKWQQRYRVNFSVFLRGDPAGRRYNSDIWWSIRFLNAWGKYHLAIPRKTLIVRYEDLQSDPMSQIERLSEFVGLALSNEAIKSGIVAGDKARMLAKADPERPPGEVHAENTQVLDWFNDSDKRFVSHYCRKLLKFDFGYNYQVWE